ncbi:MAG: fatty acid desaturase [Methyloceanibacter sp.]|uniref:fatty acid desaturase n=1 Tax=Methyloceanibacter sp. TaxID=1965321 RepID=UPI003D9B3F63
MWRCLTIVFWYHAYFWRNIAFKPHIPGMRPLAIHIIVAHLIYYGIAIGLSVMDYWREVLMLWIFPHILASALINYFFAYLTHKPHVAKERYRDTNVFWFRGRISEPLVNWLYLFQNFHLIHHLFPRVPFYLYGDAFRSVKPVLEQENARIFEFGHTRITTIISTSTIRPRLDAGRDAGASRNDGDQFRRSSPATKLNSVGAMRRRCATSTR